MLSFIGFKEEGSKVTVQENLLIVNEVIKESCARAGRSLQDIKLVAVTKTVGIEKQTK